MLHMFDSPFKAATVFLSHRCADHAASEYLFRKLQTRFRVWYSCGGALKIGDPILPRRQLVDSNFILFLASELSLSPTSVAKSELALADILNIREAIPLGIVVLGDFRLPREYSEFLFDVFHWQSRSADAERIAQRVEARLIRDARMKPVRSGDHTVYVVRDVDAIIYELLHGSRNRAQLLLNSPFRYYEMSRIVEILKAQKKNARDLVIEKLQDIFLAGDSDCVVARQNAVFVLGKMAKRDTSLIKSLTKRFPEYDEPFLYRGFHIALSYSSDDALMEPYMDALETEKTPEWRVQRKINREFHCLYYGGEAGALNELRASLLLTRPHNLLRLNTFTLGEFARTAHDLKILLEAKPYLIKLGVPAGTIDMAEKKIHLRQV